MHLYQEETFCPFKKRTNAKPETPSTIAGDAIPIGLATANVWLTAPLGLVRDH